MRLGRLASSSLRLCGLVAALSLGAGAAEAQQRVNPFLSAKSWAFQLRNLGPDQQAKIAASPFDLVVIDSEQFPDDKEIPLTREEVERMKRKPDGSRRLVIAYFSVGEAESYRYYWKPEWSRQKPSWVGRESKEWKNNFLVKYWEPVWQSILYGSPNAFADRIIAQGFDGFYIDRADAYYYFGDTKEMRDRMAGFIIELTAYMRSKQPDVAILVQNAEELLDRPAYVEAIDGIAKEDLFYGITHREEPNKKADVDWSTKLLRDAQARGKKIFVIEYLTKPSYIADARKRLDDLGFVMYTGPRGLAELHDGPRRGPIDPTPEHPSARQGIASKAVEKAGELEEKAKASYAKAKERAKALVGRQQPKLQQ
jgi:cysteinyl-tRNA synthetase